MCKLDLRHAAAGIGVYTSANPWTALKYGKERALMLSRGLRGLIAKNGTHSERGDSWAPPLHPSSNLIVFRHGSQLLPRYVVHLCRLHDPSLIASLRLPQLNDFIVAVAIAVAMFNLIRLLFIFSEFLDFEA